ncbi:Acetylornithine aminotransferase, chloroplastic/mitochondrial [Tetrabaena socialis]|uniref:acetylornithine transaminase n=1 Tax=Tetrabaena socialis TaxID=47790 RepID=A0A2J8AB76_9CHLO|nr:Acetylornithine aminotransferase, chloroplastic/mitochondrial [Tetrabaena socialis]|eukprot:PNH09779.1 Acetylornithine aminotransferase, chloroplastic/mitochondrial [Tetrabaena socialis]
MAMGQMRVRPGASHATRRSRAACVVPMAAVTVNPASLLQSMFGKSGSAAPAARTPAFTQQVISDEQKYVLQTYGRAPVVISHGKGAKMWDVEGKEYIDMAAGIAVNALGHSDARWYAALAEQAEKLAHTSNLYHTQPQVELAKRLVENSFADKAFFCNTGTEANEGAIKFARKWARVQAGIDPYSEAPAPYELVSFTNCFHGRTMGALALTYKEQYKTPFFPMMPGHRLAEYNDLESARSVIEKGKTAAVFVEPVQGEGGITPSKLAFLKGLRELCDEAGALLVFDEVQCGLGRTGKLWGHELYGVEPDIMTLAKPLAGGLPIGAVLLKQHVADVMKPGDHGSTFAGNPLVCHVACTVFDIINAPTFLTSVEQKGHRLREGLKRCMGSNPHVKDVRGVGLLVGVQLDIMAGPVVDVARDMGVMAITAGKGDVIRLVPPLVVTDAEIDQCCEVLGRALNKVAPK